MQASLNRYCILDEDSVRVCCARLMDRIYTTGMIGRRVPVPDMQSTGICNIRDK